MILNCSLNPLRFNADIPLCGDGDAMLQEPLNNVHKALTYAVKMEHLASNPADKVELPKKVRHTTNYYAAEELKMVLEKAKGTQIEPVVKLAAWFGLRRGEIIGLRWSSIDFNSNLLSITGTIKDKGASGSKIKTCTTSLPPRQPLPCALFPCQKKSDHTFSD